MNHLVIKNSIFHLFLLIYLPILGLVKSVLYTPILSIISVVGIVGTSFILLPCDFYYCYKCIFRTKMIGRNVKICLSFLIPVVVMLWFAFVCVISCFFPIVIFITVFSEPIYRVIKSNSEENNYYSLSGILSSRVVFYSRFFSDCADIIKYHWNYNYTAFPEYLEELNTPYFEGVVFEINVTQIIVGVITTFVSIFIDVVPLVLMMTIKFLPIWVNCCYIILEMWLGDLITSFFLIIPALLALALSPVIVVIGMVCVIIYSSICNLRSTVIMYKSESLKQGVLQSLKLYATSIYHIDRLTNDFMWLQNKSCLRFLDFGPEVNQYKNILMEKARDMIPILTIWNNFFKMCERYCSEALKENLYTVEDIQDADANFIIGLPNLVFARVLERSKNNEGLVLEDGTIISNKNKPDDYICTLVYPRFIKTKNDFDRLNMNETEYKFFEQWLLTNGNESKVTATVDPVRRVAIMRVISDVQAVSLIISRFPTFQNRFFEACNKAIPNL